MQGAWDGTIFSYGVFFLPEFLGGLQPVTAQGPFMLAANLNPDWPGMVAMPGRRRRPCTIWVSAITGWRVIFHDTARIGKKSFNLQNAPRSPQGSTGRNTALIGGRSLGMYSATVSMQEWQRKFGVDVDHLDQSEIVRIAETIDPAKVEKAFAWLTEKYGRN